MKRRPVRQRYRVIELQHWRDKRGVKFPLAAPPPLSAEDQRNLADRATIAKPAEPAGCAGGRLFGSPVDVLEGEVFWDRTASNCWKMR